MHSDFAFSTMIILFGILFAVAGITCTVLALCGVYMGGGVPVTSAVFGVGIMFCTAGGFMLREDRANARQGRRPDPRF